MPPGCKFHPRCRFKEARCEVDEPSLDNVAPDQAARCWVLMKNVSRESREAVKK